MHNNFTKIVFTLLNTFLSPGVKGLTAFFVFNTNQIYHL